MVMITAAAARLTGLPWLIIAWAWSRHSAKTAGGIIFRAITIPSGIRIRSSKYPNIGMGSGIKSMGLKAYPTTHAAKNLAYQGADQHSGSVDADGMDVSYGGRHASLVIKIRGILEDETHRCNPYGRPVSRRSLTANTLIIRDPTFRYLGEDCGRTNSVSRPGLARKVAARCFGSRWPIWRMDSARPMAIAVPSV
jgi:hypothetical protein